MGLRPYQTDAIAKVRSGWPEFDRQIGIAFTAAGKTVMAANEAKDWINRGKRVLFTAHRDELLRQTIRSFQKNEGIFAELEKAKDYASLQAQCVVGSAQTLIGRADRFPEDHFDLVIVDECHHSQSDSYRKILSRFDKHAKVLGLTATASRGDKRELGDYFQNIAFEIGYLQLLKLGFVAPITVHSEPLKINLNSIKITSGDYDSNALDAALSPFLQQIAESIKNHAAGRRILVFIPLIRTSQKFVEICQSIGIRARHIDGESENRAELQRQFHDGEFDLLSNSSLLGEGVDIPPIDCVVMLRPTRSIVLFTQAIGRGVRIHPGKKDLLLLDYLWLHEKHDIMRPAHLVTTSAEEAEAVTDKAFEKAEAGGGEEDLMKLVGEARSDREQQLKDKLAALANRKAKYISADEFALRRHQMDLAEWSPTMHWHEEKVTEKQAKYLEEANIDIESVRGKGHASELLDIVFRERGRLPATSGQKWVLRQNGFRSPDGLRDWTTATQNDARQFFAMRNGKKATVAA